MAVDFIKSIFSYVTGSNIYYNDGNVGIGTTNPRGMLDVKDGHVILSELDNSIGSVLAVARKDNNVLNLNSTAKQAQLIIANGHTSNNVWAGIDFSNATPINGGFIGSRITALFKGSGTRGDHRTDLIFATNPHTGSGYGLSEVMRLTSGGNVGIGTTSPSHKLDVEGYIEAHRYYTGDIIFQKDGQKLWRMFEDEKGLYLENMKTGETSRIFMEKDIKAMEERLSRLEAALLNISQ
ncbi:cell wall surface anchor family protein [Candidatus Thiomargarita nelsonii]|uniref:Cell wall surface anchor family protein n=1 Tax=Candidatus Thiomargarita nelsonii TaxID=1003181 RepID=A0A0A6NYM7_9GAMM|nr:cell wall surface anchor family protein [Candidatus Thiomargarita nelsonii]